MNFNREEFNKLEPSEQRIRQLVFDSAVLHADETGINIGGKRVWLHVCSNAQITYLMHHGKRGGEAAKAEQITQSARTVNRLRRRCAAFYDAARHTLTQQSG